MSGKLITIEGIEGAGKSTAVEFIAQYFQAEQIDHVITREPGGTYTGEAIRQVLLASAQDSMIPETELLLMFASRAQHLAEVIYPALKAKKTVVCDRFTDASYAYQGGGRQLGFDRVSMLENWVQGSLRPDLVIILDVPVEIGFERIVKRGEKDRFECEKMDFFKRVRAAYLERAKADPKRYCVINASVSLDKVQEQLKTCLMAEINVSSK